MKISQHDTIRTDTVKIDTLGELKPLKAPVDFAYTFWEIALPAGVLVLLVVAGVYLYMRYRKSRDLPGLFAKKEHALETAFKALDQLQAEYTKNKLGKKEFVEGLNAVLRNFLQARFDVAAIFSTSHQIMASRKLAGLPATLKERINDNLSEADRVKFSGDESVLEPQQKELRELLDLLFRWRGEKNE